MKFGVLDYTNLGAGFGKGISNLRGPEFDPIYFGAFALGSSLISGVSRYRKVKSIQSEENLVSGCLDEVLSRKKEIIIDNSPILEGVREGSVRGVISSVELGIGYGLGIATQMALTDVVQYFFRT